MKITLFEEFKDDHVAFIGEGSVDLVADLMPSLSLRVGYEVLSSLGKRYARIYKGGEAKSEKDGAEKSTPAAATPPA